jgi:hypothetical protein
LSGSQATGETFSSRFDADPDPNLHFDAVSDPDGNQINAQFCPSTYGTFSKFFPCWKIGQFFYFSSQQCQFTMFFSHQCKCVMNLSVLDSILKFS